MSLARVNPFLFLNNDIDAPFHLSLASSVAIIKCLTNDNFKINNHLRINQPTTTQDDPLNSLKLLYEKIPTTVFVTHHKDIFQKDLITENYLIRFFAMEAIIQNGDNYYSFFKSPDQKKNQVSLHYNHQYIGMKSGLKLNQLLDEDKLIFIYKVKPGFSVNSFAILCAKQIGFDKELLTRINEVQNSSFDNISENHILIKKHEDAVRDLLFRINDYLCFIKQVE